MTSSTAELLLVRHGQSIWNAERRWAGHADSSLSPEGVEEARAAARSHLLDQGLRAVGSSPMSRARSTAEIIATALEVHLLPAIAELSERHGGEWSGLTSPEIERNYPGMLDAWRAGEVIEIPGGEPWNDFKRRAVTGVKKAAQQGQVGERILVVTHGEVLRAIADHLGEALSSWPNLGGRINREGGSRCPAVVGA